MERRVPMLPGTCDLNGDANGLSSARSTIP